jgi:hypothetical protein
MIGVAETSWFRYANILMCHDMPSKSVNFRFHACKGSVEAAQQSGKVPILLCLRKRDNLNAPVV